MKSTGIIRKVDDLGRIVIPKELRTVLDIKIKDALEIFVEDEKIILKKYKANMECSVTGEISDENESFLNGNLVLSPKGKELLLKELSEKVGLAE
ncbi:AbrB/MazE/SpoVT family DNA-binding domain-containing protein [Evansella clarkii]|uniref:AbrB/MazE/SpoVT family DNA-binding domain-containing protein n=1 Tax=Evansella clarkii TaxID=79879 RepID=UPI000997741D|nr:AbrB/MazE/SpoVT family DNA-binding domain-containing protein [Evansella clarkii]